jgi:hypothetical protein
MMPVNISPRFLSPGNVARHQHVVPQPLHRHIPQAQGIGHATGAAPGDGGGRLLSPNDNGRDDGLHLVHQAQVEEAAQQLAAPLHQQTEDVAAPKVAQKLAQVHSLL